MRAVAPGDRADPVEDVEGRAQTWTRVLPPVCPPQALAVDELRPGALEGRRNLLVPFQRDAERLVEIVGRGE